VKVLHLHSGNLYGGVETFFVALARSRRLAPAMEMSVALSYDERLAAELRREGVPTAILGRVRLRRPDTVWRARRALRTLLAERHFDVAVCHQAWPLAIFGPVVKAAGLPLVSWIHMAPAGHWVDRLASRVEPDLIICNSKFTASLIKPAAARVAVAYYPLEPVTSALPAAHRIDAVRQELQTPASDVVVIQVSRMEALKGQQICIEALAWLARRPDWTCWQVGGAQRAPEQQYFHALRATTERLGISSRVRFTGERADVADLMAASDVYCQPNITPEGFGITFIEAMAAGLPVVTSAIGGALEIVDDTCGVLVPAGDTAAVAASLDCLIANRDERRRVSQGGRARAKALCDPAVQMGHIADLLQDVCRPSVVH
jgi:glycosyltransferase involved in cell wall biosynthesis